MWGSEGIVQVFRWAHATAAGVVPPGPSRQICGIALSGLLAAAVLGFAVKGVPGLDSFRQSRPESRIVEEIGEWIRGQQNRPVTIMADGGQIAFHAGGQWIHPPYASGEVALRFLDAAKVDYVLLGEKDGNWSNYYRDWYERGIPSSRAELVYVSSDPYFNGDLKIFRWHRPDVLAR
jgi:hypothetical protein